MTTVRLYEPQDERPLRDVALQNYIEQFQGIRSVTQEAPETQAYLTHIIQTHESGKGVILLAERESRLIGFVCLLRPDSSAVERGDESAYAFMSDLFVIQECRHQGVGTLLTREFEKQAHAMGATNVALRVAADNEGAREFYTSEQYQEKFVVMSRALSGRKR